MTSEEIIKREEYLRKEISQKQIEVDRLTRDIEIAKQEIKWIKLDFIAANW